MSSNRQNPTLRRGARGDAVVRLQKRLVDKNAIKNDNFVDGAFGPGTEREVRVFQRAKDLSVDGVVGRNTWAALNAADQKPTTRNATGQTAKPADKHQAQDQQPNTKTGNAYVDRVIRAVKRKGYKYFDNDKPYFLNIIGIRDPSTAIGKFDDQMCLIYRDETGQLQHLNYAITTDPGSHYTQTQLLNKAGAAILVPGQYEDVYKVAKHRSKYEALCQKGGKVTVWRDGNMDDKLDRNGKTYSGYYGINIHRAGSRGTTTNVGKYSAGCQVFANSKDFGVFMNVVRKARQHHGDKFTYTLLEKADIR